MTSAAGVIDKPAASILLRKVKFGLHDKTEFSLHTRMLLV